MSKHIHNLLCLGDSYTVGELVPLHQSFPYQLLQLLRHNGYAFHAPEVIAQTGWTTFELADFLIHHHLQPPYDFVTLLIGVNNQYRDLPEKEFDNEIHFLIKKAISFSATHHHQVFVVSIPDWGVTPFAEKEHKNKPIAKQIDAFNSILKSACDEHQVHYLDINPHYRSEGNAPIMLTKDELHPSGEVYAHWANELFMLMRPYLK